MLKNCHRPAETRFSLPSTVRWEDSEPPRVYQTGSFLPKAPLLYAKPPLAYARSCRADEIERPFQSCRSLAKRAREQAHALIRERTSARVDGGLTESAVFLASRFDASLFGKPCPLIAGRAASPGCARRVRPNGTKGRKKVSDFLIDAKVSMAEKQRHYPRREFWLPQFRDRGV